MERAYKKFHDSIDYDQGATTKLGNCEKEEELNKIFESKSTRKDQKESR